MDPFAVPLPQGDVTFLITDVEGSTRLLQQLGEARYRELLQAHDRLVEDALDATGGAGVSRTGDGVLAAYGDAVAAVRGALLIRQKLSSESWPSG